MLKMVGIDWELRQFDAFDVHFDNEFEVAILKELVRRTNRTVTDGAVAYKWHDSRRWCKFQKLRWRSEVRRLNKFMPLLPDFEGNEI